MKLIQELASINEMAKRSKLEDFHKLCVDEYGAEKAKALTVKEIQAVAKKHDVTIPAVIWKNKVAAGRFTAGAIDGPKSEEPKVQKAAPKAEPEKVEIKDQYDEADFEGQKFTENVRWTNGSEFQKILKQKFDVEPDDYTRVRVGEPKKIQYYGTIVKMYYVNKKDPTIVYGRADVNRTQGGAEYYLAITRAEQKKIDDTPMYGHWIMPQYGPAYLSTSTEHSYGPWSKDEAEMNIQDKRAALKYDDDFNHGGRIKVVRVKKIDGKWILE